MPQALMVAAAKTLMAVGVKAGIAKAVASFVVTQTAISVAAHAASRVLGRRSGGSATLQERQASVINVQIGEVPREAVFGTTTTGGSLVDAFSYGGQYGTDTFAQCIALADHEISRVVGFYVDDQYVTWAANGVQAGFNGKLSLLFQNASEAGHAPPSVALANGWSTSDVGRGVARVWVFVTADEQVWSQGFPRFRWVLEGAKVYDPRRDANLGYSGADPCDFGDPSTWVVSQNPILLDYAYRRGIYVTGRHQQAGQLLVGRGLSALEAPPAAIIAAANVCDEVMGPAALRYRAAGVIRADQPFVEAAEMFAAACAGVIVQREGGVEIEPGQAKAAVVTITDDDLVVGEAVSFSSFLPDTEGGRINTVVPRYVSPDQGWKDHAGPVRRSQDDITADGGPREATLALALVTDSDQADRSAEIARRLYRLERRATIVLPPRFAYLEEGDWIAWTSARHGGATVRYRIESWSMGEDWRMRLTLREIAASVFGEADPIADQAIPAPPPVPADALALADVTVQAITLAGETSTLPAVRFSWSTPVDPAILAIRAEIRVTGETEIATARTEAVGEGVLVVTNGVAPGQSQQGRLMPIGHPSRPVVPGAWVAVSTAEAVAAIAPDVRADIDAAIAAAEAEAAAAQAEAAAALAGLAAEITRATSAEGTISSSVAALSGTVNSNFTTLSNADAGLAAQIATTNSTLNGFASSTNSTLASLAAADAALAGRTTTLEALAVSVPNLLSNSDASQGLRHWEQTQGFNAILDPNVGTYFGIWSTADNRFLISDLIPCSPNSAYRFSFEGDAGAGATGCFVWVAEFSNGVRLPDQDLKGQTDFWGAGWFNSRKTGAPFTTGPNSNGFKVVVFKAASAPYCNISRIMLHAGHSPARWSNDRAPADLSARIVTEEAVRASADAALSSRTTTVEAQVALRANLCPNGGMENGLVGLTSNAAMVLGTNVFGRSVELVPAGSGTYAISWPAAPIFPGFAYTVSGDAKLFASGGVVYFDMLFTDANGNVLLDSVGATRGIGDYTDDPARRQQMASWAVAPAGSAFVVARCVFEGVVNPTAMGARRVKVEQGTTPATAYTPEGGVNLLSARVSTSEGAITSLQGRTQAWWQNSTQAGEASTLIRAQSDAAAGSSIMMVADKLGIATSVGGVVKELARFEADKIRFGTDVAIAGNLLVDGQVTTPKMANGSITKISVFSLGWQLIGNGSEQTALLQTITMDYPGVIIVMATGRHSYTQSTPQGWHLNTTVLPTQGGSTLPGLIAGAAGQGFGTDSIATSGFANVAAGQYDVTMGWLGAVSIIRLASLNIVVMQVYK